MNTIMFSVMCHELWEIVSLEGILRELETPRNMFSNLQVSRRCLRGYHHPQTRTPSKQTKQGIPRRRLRGVPFPSVPNIEKKSWNTWNLDSRFSESPVKCRYMTKTTSIFLHMMHVSTNTQQCFGISRVLPQTPQTTEHLSVVAHLAACPWKTHNSWKMRTISPTNDHNRPCYDHRCCCHRSILVFLYVDVQLDAPPPKFSALTRTKIGFVLLLFLFDLCSICRLVGGSKNLNPHERWPRRQGGSWSTPWCYGSHCRWYHNRTARHHHDQEEVYLYSS